MMSIFKSVYCFEEIWFSARTFITPEIFKCSLCSTVSERMLMSHNNRATDLIKVKFVVDVNSLGRLQPPTS